MGVSVFSYLYSHGEFYLLPISCFTMAPVEVDIIPRSIIAPIKDSKTVEKALTLPIVSDACNEVARYAEPITPYVETTYEKLSPMVELGYKTVLAKYEDSLVPLLPGAVAESVHTNYTAAEEYVKAAAEKVDTMASGGIDHLTEKLPQLKEATPKLIEDVKVTATDYLHSAAEYITSYTVAQVALKVVDTGLDAVESVLGLVGAPETGLVNTSVKQIHTTANTLRIEGIKKAGTEKAKAIEEASILGALLEVSGLYDLLGFFGFKVVKLADLEPVAETTQEAEKVMES